MVEKTSKEILEGYLKKINWSLEDIGCNHYLVVNHNGIKTKWVLWDNHLSYDRDKYGPEDEKFAVCFEITESDIRLMTGDCTVSIGPVEHKYPFILFMNHDMKKNDASKQEGVKDGK